MAIHSRLIEGTGNDCPPGVLRVRQSNVTFGAPRHRGVEGGEQCEMMMEAFVKALQGPYKEHDPLIQSLAAHYHLAAMHPFLDGNGRTARALSALMLYRAGLKGTCFIALSNYFYDNKVDYLNALNSARSSHHDLTQFLKFGLGGIVSETTRFLKEIQEHVSKALFLNVMYELVHRLKSPRKSALAKRQMKMLQYLLEASPVPFTEFFEKTTYLYARLRRTSNAFARDFGALIELGAIQAYQATDKKWMVKVRLEWPTEITQSDAFSKMKKLPHAKSLSFLHAEMKKD